ncbi:complex I subunit 1 family protein [Fodinibius sp.]|uniref:complex I subunit 1/NuoH family protein n=1 Tax=Fodinibius sp. TaxID=1872440 RepID=UPI002ACE89CF|nr:complex I subunit 1 family protein [Fodinibius sp.]MDZ7660516.1 complex I subunit 1 family protein [Fodinibius sp.]
MIIGILITLFFLAGIYFVAVLERWSLSGTMQWSSPVRSLLRLFIQEEIKPRKHDSIFFEAAPVFFIAVILLTISILPFGEGLVLIDLGTGALFINAALVYVMVCLLMAGWSVNGVYGMIGGWRALAQLIAYSMTVVMVLTATVMRAESMFLPDIIESQQSLWNILYQPIGFILFYLSAMAIAFLPPFDLPTAESELAGGVWADFTGIRKLLFRLGRLALILTLSVAVVVLYMGGWLGPWLPGYVWIFLKTLLVAASFFAVGRFVPRIRQDHLLEYHWKFGIPLALFNIFLVGGLLII